MDDVKPMKELPPAEHLHELMLTMLEQRKRVAADKREQDRLVGAEHSAWFYDWVVTANNEFRSYVVIPTKRLPCTVDQAIAYLTSLGYKTEETVSIWGFKSLHVSWYPVDNAYARIRRLIDSKG